MIDGRTIPAVSSHCSDEAISFAIDVIDASGVAQRLEELLAKGTGRPRTLPLRALLVALFLLANTPPGVRHRRAKHLRWPARHGRQHAQDRHFRELVTNREGPATVERARRRRISITDFQPPPPQE